MALSANLAHQTRNGPELSGSGTIKTASVIYLGSLLVRDAAGAILPAANATTTLFVGRALRNSTGVFPVTGDGTETVEFGFDVEIRMSITALTAATQGTVVYAADDETATSATTLGPQIGRLTERLSATEGWVWLGQGALSAAS